MKKVVSILILLLVMSMCFSTVYAGSGINNIISSMNGASNIASVAASASNIMNTINNVIGLMQVAGTGIALVVVTLLGIKYMLASPSEKAETKKMIMPILIGCLLLFGGVNIMAAIAELSTVLDF